MRLSKIIVPVLISVIAISFNACTADDTVGDDIATTQSININAMCTATSTDNDIASYTTTLSGDSIVQDENNTTLSMFIDATNTKKVCLVSGRAHIVRGGGSLGSLVYLVRVYLNYIRQTLIIKALTTSFELLCC